MEVLPLNILSCPDDGSKKGPNRFWKSIATQFSEWNRFSFSSCTRVIHCTQWHRQCHKTNVGHSIHSPVAGAQWWLILFCIGFCNVCEWVGGGRIVELADLLHERNLARERESAAHSNSRPTPTTILFRDVLGGCRGMFPLLQSSLCSTYSSLCNRLPSPLHFCGCTNNYIPT